MKRITCYRCNETVIPGDGPGLPWAICVICFKAKKYRQEVEHRRTVAATRRAIKKDMDYPCPDDPFEGFHD